jgi:hypothetical protein
MSNPPSITRFVCILALWAAGSLACRTLAAPSATPISSTSTISATPATENLHGRSRGTPFPRTGVIVLPNLEVEVQDVLRGEQAWRELRAANQFNDPAPEGEEYVLIRLKVTSQHADGETHVLGCSDLRLTGAQALSYFYAPLVPPEPAFSGDVTAGQSLEGWCVFQIRQSDDNLILIVDEGSNLVEGTERYIALDEGASVLVDLALDDIAPNTLGVDQREPARPGAAVITDDWSIKVLQVLRGEEALKLVKAANDYNDAPAEGMEYVAVQVQARYLNTADRVSRIDGYQFTLIGSDGTEYERPIIIDVRPELSMELFPGGTYTGWLILQTRVNDPEPLLQFEPSYPDQGRRYFALE